MERRQPPLQLISKTQQLTPKLSNLDGLITLQERGRICAFDFEVNCPFKLIGETAGSTGSAVKHILAIQKNKQSSTVGNTLTVNMYLMQLH